MQPLRIYRRKFLRFRGVKYPEAGKVVPVESAIPRQERIRLEKGMCPYEKVAYDPLSAALRAMPALPPEPTCSERGVW